jgi:dipeptidyl aminopeptidase/acylaminoacyl peptidase
VARTAEETADQGRVRDPRVEAAVSHWAHRFVANGVPLSDFQDVTGGIRHWDEWCPAWSQRAAVHEQLGDEALAAGQHLTAGEHLERAAVCYHFAKYLFVQDQAQMRQAHRRAVECRQRALPHLRPPGERVEIPFEGTVMAGILRRPAGVTRPPVVAMAMGLDSGKEEMGTNELPFLQRGIATLAFDGPGQGELEYDLPIRGDWEVPVAAVIDWIEQEPTLDADRIGLWGVSLGGYYAPRAVAVDRRIKACIALAGPYNFGAAWDGLPELTREAFRVRSHLGTEHEARQHAHTLSLEGMADRITCPLLVVFGRQDTLLPAEGAERLAAEAAGPTRLLMIEDGDHVCSNRIYRYRPQSADWLAGRLQTAR